MGVCRFNRRQILGLAAAVLFVTVAPVSLDATLAAPIAPSAVVTFRGQEFVAVPGLVLGQGQLDTAAGVCIGVEHSIRITAPKTIGYPTSVYSPSTTAAYCWVNGAGWTILGCYGWVELNGPSQVQQFTGGDFENQFGSLRHHLGAHPNAWIGGNGVFCDSVGASMPPSWHDHCEYGRFW